MEKFIFASDLDRTLIYSYRFIRESEPLALEVVEYYDGKPISYMTKKALEKFQQLRQKLLFVPVTTRSKEQYNRIKPFQECEWAVTTNGGKIFYKGQEHPEWHRHVKEVTSLVDYDQLLPQLELERLAKEFNFDYKVRLVDGIFFYLRISDESKQAIRLYLDNTLPKGWVYTIQGVKLYIIPEHISKEAALSFILEKTQAQTVITAGDGELDINFLQLGHVILSPSGSRAHDYLIEEIGPEEVNTVPVGFKGVETLLELVEEAVN